MATVKEYDSPRPEEHPDFPVSNGNTVFRVEDTLFGLNRYALIQHSPAFADMLSLGSTCSEGTKEYPIVLPCLGPSDFEKFLRVLYPRRFDELPFKTASEWYSVLVVADLYEFRECGIHKLAIEQLEKTASWIEKINFGERFRIRSLLIQGYGEACTRNCSLNKQELSTLPTKTIVLIMSKRESILYKSGRCRACPIYPSGVSDEELGLGLEPPTTQFSFTMSTSVDSLIPAHRVYRTFKPLPAREACSRQSFPKPDFQEEFAIFSVDGSPFLVPRFVTNPNSPNFKSRSMLVPEDICDSFGAGTEADPYILEGVTQADFERILRIIYPQYYGDRSPQSAEDWRFVLQNSANFPSAESNIRSLCLERIMELASSIQMVAWGEVYDCEAMYNTGIRNLCRRIDYLTEKELALLSLSSIVRISAGREIVMRARRCGHCKHGGIKMNSTDDDVAAHFAELLRDAE